MQLKVWLILRLMTSSGIWCILIHKAVFIIPRYICTPSLLMISLFGFSVITKNVLFSLIKRDDSEVTLLHHRCCHHHENTFSYITWDDLFISGVKTKLCWIFEHFQNDEIFLVNLLVWSITGSWACWPMAFLIVWALHSPNINWVMLILNIWKILSFRTWTDIMDLFDIIITYDKIIS